MKAGRGLHTRRACLSSMSRNHSYDATSDWSRKNHPKSPLLSGARGVGLFYPDWRWRGCAFEHAAIL